MNSTFQAIRERRAVRYFSQREVSLDLIRELLELANRAPSGFNLQPWYFVVVSDPTIKKLLAYASFGQRQMTEAPLVVAFVADPYFWKTRHAEVLRRGIAAGAITAEYAAFVRKQARLTFTVGPLGIFGLIKRLGAAIRRLAKPTPLVISQHSDVLAYVRSQTMLAAATFMIAAKSADLDTCPMEGFDEVRVKKLLNIPQHMTIPLLIPVGYRLEIDERPQSIRLGLDEKLKLDVFR